MRSRRCTQWEKVNGYIFCYLTIPELSHPPAPTKFGVDCVFGIRMYGYGPDTWPGDEPAPTHVELFIDGQPVGERQFEGWMDTALHVRLAPGYHEFAIIQVTGSASLLFQSVRVWQTSTIGPPKP
jgi:hypothetical protein